MTESKNWKPGKWTVEAICRRMGRVYRVALKDMEYLIGGHMARLVFADVVARMKAEQSKIEIHRAGYRVIGDK